MVGWPRGTGVILLLVCSGVDSFSIHRSHKIGDLIAEVNRSKSHTTFVTDC